MSDELRSNTSCGLTTATDMPASSVRQTGDKNVYAKHVDTLNIFVQGENTVAETIGTLSFSKDSIDFGDIEISPEDYQILEEFRKDYAQIMEYTINTDFTSELVDINYSDNISNLYNEKWRFKSKDFKNSDLRKLKNKILKTLNELTYYVSDEFMRYHERSGMIIFRNQSWEEGCRLRDDFQPNSLRLRQNIANLYRELYLDEFVDEDV
ncbi:hypothetical protein Q5O14_08365 [Eubacteriaceae bacterium ES2]|nr:hypothetical protein Q5O14_08365 [Eubacteriaceae bacterium ES2]